MRVNKKRVWLGDGAFLALAIVAAIGWVWWNATHQPPPQIITLSAGEQYRLAGVTYATKNIPPTLAAHFVSWLPDRLVILARKYFGVRASASLLQSKKFDSPHLFVWFQRLGTNTVRIFHTSPFEAFVANQSGEEGCMDDVECF